MCLTSNVSVIERSRLELELAKDLRSVLTSYHGLVFRFHRTSAHANDRMWRKLALMTCKNERHTQKFEENAILFVYCIEDFYEDDC